MTSKRTAAITIVAIVAVVGAGVALGVHLWGGPGAADQSSAGKVPVATAKVQMTTLSSTTQLSGTLGHGLHIQVFGGPAGATLTGFPAEGTVVTQGQELFEANGQPVALFYGSRPMWRDLSPGVPPGPDVLELEQNLVALGFANTASVTVDEHYTWATARAVKKWQHATGQATTGNVAEGSVVFDPGALRVDAASLPLGSMIQPGQAVLTVDSTDVGVIAQVPTTQTYLVHPGDVVSILLPSGTPIGGRVVSLSKVAQSSDSSPPGSQGPPQVTLPVIVSLDDPTAAGGLDQAPVTVNVTDKTVENVLAVPITALVALAGGGYGLYVVDGQARHLIGVTPGLFASTLVQVTSPQLKAGDRVQVPAA